MRSRSLLPPAGKETKGLCCVYG